MDTATRVTLATCAVLIAGSIVVGARMHAIAQEQTVPGVRLLVCPAASASLTHYMLSDVWRFTCNTDQGREIPLPPEQR